MSEPTAASTGHVDRGRRLLKGLVFGGGGLMLIAGLLLVPAIQTVLARQFLPNTPTQRITLDRVSIRPGLVVVDNLQVVRSDIEARVPRLEIQVGLLGLLTKRADVAALKAHGWTAQWHGSNSAEARHDPVHLPPATAGWTLPWAQLSGAPAHSDQAWRRLLELPIALRLQTVDLEGHLGWDAQGTMPSGTAGVTVSGGGIGEAVPGRLRFGIDAESSESTAGIDRIRIDSTLEVSLAERRRVTDVRLSSRLESRFPQGGDTVHLGVNLHANLEPAATAFEIDLSDGSAPIGSLVLAPISETELAGSWTLSIADQNIRPFLLGYPLPTGAIRGGGAVAGNLATSEFSGDGSITFNASALEVFRPELAAVGALSGKADFAVSQSPDGVRVTSLAFSATGAAPVAEFRLLQGIEFDQRTGELRVESPASDVFSLALTGLPAAWLQPWLEPWVLDSHPISGRWVGAAIEGGMVVRSTSPLQMTSLALSRSGVSYLSGLSISTQTSLTAAGEAWQVELAGLQVSDATGRLVGGEVRAGFSGASNGAIKVEGTLTGDLAGLTRQELLADWRTLRTGTFSTEFTVGLGDTMSVAFSSELPDLTLRDGTALPRVVAEGRLDLAADGMIEAHVPLQLERANERSEVTINVQARPATAGWMVAGSVSGPKIYLADFQALTLIADTEVAAQPAPALSNLPAASALASPLPVWGGIEGTLQAAIGELVLPNGMAFSELRSTIRLTPAALELSELTLDIDQDGRLSSQARIDFAPTSAGSAYNVQASLSGEQVEVAPILRLLKPGQPPLLEGRFGMQVNLSGRAPDLDATVLDHLAIDGRVESGNGVLRALTVRLADYARTGQTVATIANLLAQASGNERLARNTGRVEAATAVASQLSEIAFDQLALEFARPNDGNYQLRNLAVTAPNMRLVGSGRVQYSPTEAFWRMPLELRLSLSAREGMANNLGTLNLLRNEPDTLGYLPMVQPLELSGTLMEISTAQIQSLLGRAITALRPN